MMWAQVSAVVLLTLAVSAQKPRGPCKNPTVEHRLLADDVRYASPFYMIALPRTPTTQQIDNVCYTYFDTADKSFFHVMSVVFKNGTNSYHTFSKGDISDRMGLAQATAEKISHCVYHDYTLVPICNVSVFVLYRCFIEGTCNDIDIGITPGVDVRVVLAASTNISEACRHETEGNLKDTSNFEGGDYVILPQSRKPQCVTHYGDKTCINAKNALGSLTLTDQNLEDRFGSSNNDLVFTGTTVAVLAKDSSTQSESSNTEIPTIKESSSQSPLNATETATVNEPPVTSQPTPQTTVPRRSYADVVKSSLNPVKKPTKGSVKQ